jgi:hypothetical protein
MRTRSDSILRATTRSVYRRARNALTVAWARCIITVPKLYPKRKRGVDLRLSRQANLPSSHGAHRHQSVGTPGTATPMTIGVDGASPGTNKAVKAIEGDAHVPRPPFRMTIMVSLSTANGYRVRLTSCSPNRRSFRDDRNESVVNSVASIVDEPNVKTVLHGKPLSSKCYRRMLC